MAQRTLGDRLDQVRGDDGGAVVIVVALLAVTLLGMAAFTVDLGIAYASKREQSVTVDAAALAGAQAAGVELQTLYPTGTSCDDAVANSLTAAATAAAAAVYEQQRPQGEDIGAAISGAEVSVACAGTEAIDVVVDSTADIPTLFGGVLQVDSLSPSASATARVSGAEAYGGLRPYAVCDDAIVRGNEGLTQQSLYAKKDAVSCGPLPPGAWGIVDFDGGANPNGDIARWTRFGYNGPITIPDPEMPGDPGNDTSAPVKSALDSIIGDIVLLPVAQAWNEGGGNNATFDMTGVIAVEICGYRDGKKPAVKGACWKDSFPAPGPNDFVLQWQWRPFFASYLSGTGDATECSLSDPNCLPAVRLYR